MISKLAQLVTLALIATMAFALSGKEEKKAKINEIFDNDSDFMRGFETGLFLRTKGGTIEEYGCAAPANLNSKGT